MNNNTEKSIQKNICKYYCICGILGGTLVLFLLLGIFVFRSYIITIITLLFVLLGNRVVIRIVANKTLFSVLYNDFDATAFKKIIYSNRFRTSLIDKMNAALLSGDYQTAINIATKQSNNKKIHIRLRCYYLSVLARTYFELRDFEKLKTLLAKYDEYQTRISSKKSEDNNSIWEYYRSFLESDYEACKLLCSLRNGRLKDNACDTKLRKIQNNFLYATACYENGESDQAEQTFLCIVQKAPNLYISILSQKYVASIKGDKLYFEEIFPDSSYQFVENKKFKVIRLIRNISLLFSIAVLIVLAFIPKTMELSEYERKLQIALSQQYTDFDILDYMNVEENGAVKDVLVFIKNETGEIDVGFIMTHDNGNTYDVEIVESNITYNSYTLDSFTGAHGIELLISNQKYTDKNDSYSTTVIKNFNKVYYVYAKCI